MLICLLVSPLTSSLIDINDKTFNQINNDLPVVHFNSLNPTNTNSKITVSVLYDKKIYRQQMVQLFN
jgi:hypothetical protein